MSGEKNNIETYNIHGIGQGGQVYSKIVGSQSYHTLTKKLKKIVSHTTDYIYGIGESDNGLYIQHKPYMKDGWQKIDLGSISKSISTPKITDITADDENIYIIDENHNIYKNTKGIMNNWTNIQEPSNYKLHNIYINNKTLYLIVENGQTREIKLLKQDSSTTTNNWSIIGLQNNIIPENISGNENYIYITGTDKTIQQYNTNMAYKKDISVNIPSSTTDTNPSIKKKLSNVDATNSNKLWGIQKDYSLNIVKDVKPTTGVRLTPTYNDITNPTDCGLKCYNTPNCNAFKYTSKTKPSCILYSSIDGTTPSTPSTGDETGQPSYNPMGSLYYCDSPCSKGDWKKDDYGLISDISVSPIKTVNSTLIQGEWVNNVEALNKSAQCNQYRGNIKNESDCVNALNADNTKIYAEYDNTTNICYGCNDKTIFQRASIDGKSSAYKKKITILPKEANKKGNKNVYTKDNAEPICKKYGGRVCSKEEITDNGNKIFGWTNSDKTPLLYLSKGQTMNIDNKPYNGPQVLQAKSDVDKAMVYCCGDIHDTPVNNIVESFTTNNKSFMRNVKLYNYVFIIIFIIFAIIVLY